MTDIQSTATGLRLIVETVPGPACSPNSREHWSEVYRARRELKEAVAWASAIAVPVNQRPYFGDRPVMLAIRIIWPKGRKRMDDDNAIAACKAARDALNKVVWDDDRQVTMLPIVQQTWSESGRVAEYQFSGCLVLDIEEAAA